jgi:uncharacterized protein
MKISLQGLPPGKKKIFRQTLPGKPDWLELFGGIFTRSVEVEVLAEDTGGAVSLQGLIRLVVEGQCSLCLENFTREYVFSFAQSLGKTGEGDEEAIVLYTEEAIDLLPLLEETVILNLPLAPVCQEGCAGLCAGCGQNLNIAPCGCVQDTIDPRLEKLRQLL